MADGFRARVLAREPLLGAFVTSPSEVAVEMIAAAGFDFLVIDTEHGLFDPESVGHMLRAADASKIPAIVRVPSCHSPADAGRALDTGAAGTLFPRADGLAAVRGAVECVKFAPAGKRGLAGVRANRYGAVPFDHFVRDANASTAVIVQIETAGALNVAAEIAAEEGVDLLFVGPNDLSQSLGVPGHYEEPRYRAAVERIGSVAREAGKAAGIMLRTRDEIPGLAKVGYSLFTISDRTLLIESARAWRAAVARD